MQALLKKLNFSRSIILLSFIGSALLGYLLYVERIKLQNLEAGVAYGNLNVPKIITKSRELDALIKASSREDFGNDVNALESYIRERAVDRNANLGQLDVSKPKTVNIASGESGTGSGAVEDVVYTVTPSRSGNRQFSRSEVSNFAYLLEQDSRRVKVSMIKLLPTAKNPKPEQLPDDRWNFELDVRVRVRKDASNSGG